MTILQWSVGGMISYGLEPMGENTIIVCNAWPV